MSRLDAIRQAATNFMGKNAYAGGAALGMAGTGVVGGMVSDEGFGSGFMKGLGVGAMALAGTGIGKGIGQAMGKGAIGPTITRANSMTMGMGVGNILGTGAGLGFASMMSNDAPNPTRSTLSPGARRSKSGRMSPQERMMYNKAMLEQKLDYHKQKAIMNAQVRLQTSMKKKQIWDARQKSRRMPRGWTSDMPWQ